MKRTHTLRFATNADGPAIAALMDSCGYDAKGLDWSAIEPYWIVSEEAGQVIGCAQVAYSKPMARVDMVGVSYELGAHRAAAVYRDLLVFAIAAMRDFGAQTAIGFVPFERRNIVKFYRRFGALPCAQGNMIELRFQGGA
jgi:N-acetylglutamate synthase-like GNAT family acetyltransferase